VNAGSNSTVLLRARSSVCALYGFALVAFALAFTHPLVLLAVAAATFGAARLSGVQRQLRGAVRFAIPLALMLAVINGILVRDGVTVLWRFGELPLFGQLDLTGEAFAYGFLLALRVVVIIAASALLVAIVDPDDVLRRMRRSAFRSALTAALATRMIGVLTRDARRMDQARRCRPDGGGSGRRAQLLMVGSVAAGALDRAVDVAATLELRGYATRVAPPRGDSVPYARADRAVLASAVGLLALLTTGVVFGLANFEPYPRITVATDLTELLYAALIVLAALAAPIIGERGRRR
jgi:energy-coupling factor transport system permease protein